MERGRGGRGRGRGRSSGPGSVVNRVKQESKRKIAGDDALSKKQKTSEITSQLQFDEKGKIIADIAPTKKFAAATASTLLTSFLRDVEYGAQVTRTNQTIQSESPRRLLDNMKVQPVEKWPGYEELIESLWKTPRTAATEYDRTHMRELFNRVIEAMEQDVGAYEKQLGITTDATTTKKRRKKLLTEIENLIASECDPPAFWMAIDPDDHVYTDSEEEEDGRNQRFPPALQLLRNLRRRLINNEQRNLLLGRSLALVQADATFASIAADNNVILQEHLHTEKAKVYNEERSRLRDWMKASLYAQRYLQWAPNTDLNKTLSGGDAATATPKQNSLIALIRTELGRLFPERLLSAEVERFAMAGNLSKLPPPYSWLLDNSLCLTPKELQTLDLPPLKIQTGGQRLYFGNLLQMLGRPMGRSYSHVMFHQDFKFWLTSIGERGLEPLQVLAQTRPPSRQLRALIAKRLSKTSRNRDVDESLISAIGNITGAGGGGQTHTQAAATAEYEDSEASRSEDEQYERETTLMKSLVTKPEVCDFSGIGFGAESVLLRIGGGIGRLRNTFDCNRHRRMGLELLKNDSRDPVPLDFESSEDEDKIYADFQNVYRRHYRENKEKLIKSSPPEKYSDWPGRSTDRLRERWEREEMEAAKKSKTKRSKKRRTGDDAAASFDKVAAVEESIGMQEEVWRTFNFKPRVRHIEYRMDLGKKSKVPIGFMAKGTTAHGRELQLVGIDEGEIQRRFGLTKLFQKALPGVNTTLVHRRRFAAVIDERNGVVRIVDASPCRLIFSDSPSEAHRDLMWNLYWHHVRTGVHEQHLLKKTLRYRNMCDNNSIVWKDDLDRYQKLREKLNETQAQRELRFMKLRPGTYSAKHELEEMGLPNFDYQYADAPKFDVDAVTDSDISEVDYFQIQTNKKTDLRSTSTSMGCNSDVDSAPQPIPIQLRVFNDPERTPDHVRVTFEETKAEARRAKLNAEELEPYSNAKRLRRHLRVIWNGTEVTFRRKIAARHRHLLQSMFFDHNRTYRQHYRRIRDELAERILYETAWHAAAVKRARGNQAAIEDGD
eukprot:Gregarina_sp_Poly_1__1028@NODE_1251_length_4627_cov_12_996930_g852_i0_p1_GENE_NODE_1251_length_4627_cov_12_996930_g852_i0NODE_1251_length_4627_cov_12_996930_g852_i0_p1_ORF_typecomplete_len1059_score191_87_NODE_1251_length_4627_cov_12_996930_g852_i013834559